MKHKEHLDYFIQQSKLSAPEGYVCLGYGTGDCRIYDRFNSSQIYAYDNVEQFSSKWSGSLEDKLYYVSKENWEKVFGELDHKPKIKDMKNIYTKIVPAATELIYDLVKDKSDPPRVADGGDTIWVWGYESKTSPYKGFTPASSSWLSSYGKDLKEVSLGEFISEIEAAPIIQKDIVIDILPWTVVIRGNKVNIGCQHNVDLSTVKAGIKTIQKGEGHLNVIGGSAKLSRKGWRMSGEALVTWEVWDKFVEEFNRLVKD